MIRIAICDDDFFCRRELEELCIQYYGSDCDISMIEDGMELLARIENTDFDIVFLDIEMQSSNGIEIKNYLEENQINCAIIFCTSHETYMQDAFGRNVYGYLTKPVQKDKLFPLLDRFYIVLNIDKTVVITDIHGKERAVSGSTIYYICAELNYTRVVLESGESILVHCSLKKWLDMLGTRNFVKIHKSYIVNFDHVEYIDQDVHIKNHAVPIPKTKLKQIKQIYASYLSGKLGC